MAPGWITYLICCIYLMSVSVLLPGCAKNKVYKHPDWKSFKPRYKTMAVLPFHVSYTFEQRPKRLSLEEIEKLEQKAEKNLRQDIYTYFHEHRAGKKIQFQSISTTDSLLKKAGIHRATINQYTEKELAEMLGVDAVFSVDVGTHYFRSEIEALAILIFSIFTVNTKDITANATIHDGKSGELVWNYERSFKGGLLDSERKIRKVLKRKITKRFPLRGK
jgi:hypothetical protein